MTLVHAGYIGDGNNTGSFEMIVCDAVVMFGTDFVGMAEPFVAMCSGYSSTGLPCNLHGKCPTV